MKVSVKNKEENRMEWKTKEDIESVLEEIGRVSQKYREHSKTETPIRIGDDGDFELHLWNGVKSATPIAWMWINKNFGSMANTIGQGICEIMVQMYEEMGCYPKHECPTCHRIHEGYDLSELPVKALEDVMQEVVEIGAAMSPGKTEANTGYHCGPTVSIEINTTLDRVNLYFSEVQERFQINKYSFLIFESTRGLCTVQAIEDALAQARKHFETHKPHKCPICGCTCE